MLKAARRKPLWRLGRIILAIYLGLMLLVFVGQRRLIYQPAKASYESLAKIASVSGFEPWRNASGQFIGWKKVTQLGRGHGCLLIVHGNAGCAIDRLDYAAELR